MTATELVQAPAEVDIKVMIFPPVSESAQQKIDAMIKSFRDSIMEVL
jgi:hypothetical protein